MKIQRSIPEGALSTTVAVRPDLGMVNIESPASSKAILHTVKQVSQEIHSL